MVLDLELLFVTVEKDKDEFDEPACGIRIRELTGDSG